MRRIPLLLLAAILMTIPSLARAAEDVSFYGPCWADASGGNGKGGVSIVTVGKDPGDAKRFKNGRKRRRRVASWKVSALGRDREWTRAV